MSAVIARYWLPFFDEEESSQAFAPSAGSGLAVSIKERILRQLKTTAAAITGVAGAYRWDVGRWRSGSTYVEYIPRDSVMVVCDSDALVEEAMNGPVTKRMEVAVSLKILRDSDDTTKYDSLARRWENDVEAAVLADPFIVEAGTSVRLATDSRSTTLPVVDTDQGQYEVIAAVNFEVDYRHDWNNPSKLGTVITAVTE